MSTNKKLKIQVEIIDLFFYDKPEIANGTVMRLLTHIIREIDKRFEYAVYSDSGSPSNGNQSKVVITNNYGGSVTICFGGNTSTSPRLAKGVKYSDEELTDFREIMKKLSVYLLIGC